MLASRDLRRLLVHLMVLSAGTLIVALGIDSPDATAAQLADCTAYVNAVMANQDVRPSTRTAEVR